MKDLLNNLKRRFREKGYQRRTKKAAALQEDTAYDLVWLYKRRLVAPEATGRTITRVIGRIENRTDKSILVSISPGTYFIAKGHHQNMVTREEYSLLLSPRETRTVSVDATCINAGLPIPDEDNRFFGVRKVPKHIERFLIAAEAENAMVVQSGVWALTDHYTGSEVREHLVARDARGNSRPAVSEHDIERARQILHELRIPNRL